jgi:MYXO-CTERM domain-containing protein
MCAMQPAQRGSSWLLGLLGALGLACVRRRTRS